MEYQGTKSKISRVISEYKRLFPVEYSTFCSGIQQKVSLNANKHGEIKNAEYITRIIAEYPETMYAAFKLNLNEDDWGFFDSTKGMRWFVEAYPEFKRVEKV